MQVGGCAASLLPGPAGVGAPSLGLPPPKAPHRPDSAARVPRGVDVRVCEGKAEDPSVRGVEDMEGDGVLCP